MKIVNPSVEVLRTGYETDFMTPEQFVEKVGRTCYKSEDKITAESAPKFVRNLINRGHEAMIEHWTLIFRVTDFCQYEQIMFDWSNYNDLCCGSAPVHEDSFQPKIRFTDVDDRYIISGNIRAWRDFIRVFARYGHLSIPGFLFEVMDAAPVFFEDIRSQHADTRPEGRTLWLTPITVRDLEGDLEHLVHHDVTLKFVCDRGVSHELKYMTLIDIGCAPQEARAVLPNSLKTEVIVTGSMGHWHHFFGLRCGPEAQPDMRGVACMARDILQEALNNYANATACEN